MYQYYVYIRTNFSQKYKTHKLVYFEETNSITTAITHEKQLKNSIDSRREIWLTQQIQTGLIWLKIRINSHFHLTILG